MSSDPFAALRVADTGVSNYGAEPIFKHDKHQTPDAVFAGNPQKTAAKHLIHHKHADNDVSANDGGIANLIAATGMPAEWAAGIVKLKRMVMPRFAKAERWQQIVTDAESMATKCHQHAADLGWSVTDLFAFDLDADREWEGLVSRIRGGRVVIISAERAVVIRDDGSRSWHDRAGFYAVPADARLIWQLRDAP